MADATIRLPSRRIKDLRGLRYGRLVVEEFDHITDARKAVWRCRCDCGTTAFVQSGELNRKGEGRHGVRSCGCLTPDAARETFTRHGHATAEGATPEYQAWRDMRNRCTNPNAGEWKRYGARGVAVCAAWTESFEAFIADVGLKPSPDLTLERIDTNGNYEPGNVRWATRKEQQRNRRCTRFIVYRGERMPLVELAERAGISRHALTARLRKGMTPERAVLGP